MRSPALNLRILLLLAASLLLPIRTAYAADRVLTVLATADVHAHVGPSYRGGDWLRLATLIEQERAAAGGAEKTLLLDCGDTLQGTGIGAYTRGEVSTRLLDHLRYDAWAVGNHDLDFGTARLSELIAALKTPALSGNLTLEGRRLPAYTITEKDDLRVAVIGMNSAFLEGWLWGDAYSDFQVEPPLTALHAVMPTIMAERPDLIVLAIHAGWGSRDDDGGSTITTIARTFPQLDLIIGGHSHRPVGGMQIASTWFVQPEADAKSLVRVRLELDDAGRLQRVSSQLLKPDADTPQSTTASDAVADLMTAYRKHSETVVSTAPVTVGGGEELPGSDNLMSELICRALLHQSGADAALHGVHNRFSWKAGEPVTEGDLFISIPFENQIGVITLSRDELIAVINEQLATSPARYRHGIAGLYVDLNRQNRVAAIRDRDGQLLAPDRQIRVVTSGFLLAGGGGRYPVLAAAAQREKNAPIDKGATTREALREYIHAAPDWAGAIRWIRPAERSGGSFD